MQGNISSGLYIRLSATKIAVLDTTEYYGEGRIITRINVPEDFRGQGHGRALLREAIRQADEHGVDLWLEISESDGLNWDALRSWYRRAGFKRRREAEVYVRRAKAMEAVT